MSDLKNRPEPKKIKMPPLVDRSQCCDTMGWSEAITNETNSQNDTQSVQQLESLQTDKVLPLCRGV